MLPVLILEDNYLYKITVNSAEACGVDYTSARFHRDQPYFRQVLPLLKETTLVVKSGVALNIKEKDIPPREAFDKYPISVSKRYVYSDNPRLAPMYSNLKDMGSHAAVDLSVTIINPSLWDDIPETDRNVLNKMKRLRIPRYMNHKTDPLNASVVCGKDALVYGMLGEKAAIWNYIPNLWSGEATVSESYAYCFDKLEPFLDGLEDTDKAKIQGLIDITNERISGFRKKLFDIETEYDK